MWNVRPKRTPVWLPRLCKWRWIYKAQMTPSNISCNKIFKVRNVDHFRNAVLNSNIKLIPYHFHRRIVHNCNYNLHYMGHDHNSLCIFFVWLGYSEWYNIANIGKKQHKLGSWFSPALCTNYASKNPITCSITCMQTDYCSGKTIKFITHRHHYVAYHE